MTTLEALNASLLDIRGLIRVREDALAKDRATEAALLDAIEKAGACCGHASDCAVHNAPALPVGPCDCGAKESPHA